MRNAASTGGPRSRDWINWESLADNQLLYFYFGNDWDWTSTHNWMAAGPKRPGEGGWRFYSWDVDVSMYDVNEHNLGQSTPQGVFPAMMNDEDFRVYFRDRVYKHCFHDGVLRPDGLREAFDYRVNELWTAIVPETARWQASGPQGPPPWDRDGEWQAEIDYMRNAFFPGRTAVLLDQLRARGWYPVEAPEFTPHGGEVSAGFTPSITAGPGTVYLTTDGSDPRLPGGAVNPNAVVVSGSSSSTTLITRGSVWKYLDDGSDQMTAWREPGFDDASWSEDNAEFGYGDGDEATTVSFGPSDSQKHWTTYFRRTFTVNDASAVSAIFLELKRDDGAVVYINGNEVWRSNMADGVVDYQTPAFEGQRDPGENSFFTKNDVPPSVLVDGENTVAVEVHQILQTSSDLSFDFSLAVVEPSNPSHLAVDESTVMRARLLQGGEWSPLNEVAFLVGAPADDTNLVVSEFSYRPSRPTGAEDPLDIYSRTDFEFVELQNISSEPIYLQDVRFTDGIGFDFAYNPIIGLDPGEQVLIVEDLGAFTARYPGVALDRIAGEYDNNLSNDGERIEILGTGDAVIRDFIYNDKAPWPEAADGDGYSLELIDPAANPDHAVAENWRASRGIHGTPNGIWTAYNWLAWQALNFSTAELADPLISGPQADLDLDFLTNFAEFALGTAPDDGITRAALPESSVIEVGGEDYLALTYREWQGALGVNYLVEVSHTLASWQSGPLVVVEVGSPVDNGDGTITRVFRSTTPIRSNPRQFMRLRMSN